MDKLDRILAYADTIPGVDVHALSSGLQMWEVIETIQGRGERHMSSYGISKSQFVVLEELFHEEDKSMTPADLANSARLARTSMTSCLDGLEKLGYIERLPHPDDRRSLLVHLTESGQSYIEEHMAAHYRIFSDVNLALTPEEADTIVCLTRKILERMKSIVDKES